jgi:hypothetical protein
MLVKEGAEYRDSRSGTKVQTRYELYPAAGRCLGWDGIVVLMLNALQQAPHQFGSSLAPENRSRICRY